MNIIEYRMVEGSRLTYIKTTQQRDKSGRFLSEYQCACGNTILRARSTVEGKNTLKSCGCAKRDASRVNAARARASKPDGWQKKITKHGMTGTKFYRVYKSMVNRCTRPGVKSYSDYGARGITVSDRWMKFENFMEDMHESYEEHIRLHGSDTTLERIDNSKGYSRENCRWATRLEQAQNTTQVKLIEHNGETRSISGWAKYYGVSSATLWSHLNKGRTVDEAIAVIRAKAVV